MAPANDSLEQLIRVEHYRLHCVEAWPDSPDKQAALAGIQSALERLRAALPAPLILPVCMVCADRKRASKVLKFPATSPNRPVVARLAA